MTATLTRTDAPCSCGTADALPRLLVTIADDPLDASRSALTQRTMTAVVCRRCIDRALTPRDFRRSRFD